MNSSIDDWVSDCQTLVKVARAEAEPAGAGYFLSSASKQLTRMLSQCQMCMKAGTKRAHSEVLGPSPEAVVSRMSTSVLSTVFQKESDESL